MDDKKMKDYFNLPVSELAMKICSNEAVRENCDGVAEFEAIDLAINSHDKLTEQNKMLREALIRISEWDNMSQEFRMDHGSRGQQRVIVDIATKALEKTK